MLRFGRDPRANRRLVPFLNQHLRAIAVDLVRTGAIDGVPDPPPKQGAVRREPDEQRGDVARDPDGAARPSTSAHEEPRQ